MPADLAVALVPSALVVLGLTVLVVGGEFLVRGASRLAVLARLSALVIGLTVVAFGTGAPELAVSIKAVLSGATDVVIGNVIGSNIANVLLILGVSALAAPLVVASHLVRVHVPVMIAASLLVWMLALDGRIGRLDGLLLLSVFIVYTLWSVRTGRSEAPSLDDLPGVDEPLTARGRHSQGARAVALALLWVAVGLAGLALGSRWLVDGAVELARLFGVSELIIGLTVVAIGTSLPELVTSVSASLKGERDISAGNVVGSNMFNMLAVFGFAALIAAEGLPVSTDALGFDFPVMLLTALVCWPVFFVGNRIGRWEGGGFLLYYLAYLWYLVLEASGSVWLVWLEPALFYGAMPLTLMLLVLTLGREMRRRSRSAAARESGL